MKTQSASKLAVLASFGLGAVVIQGVPADSRPSSYVTPEIGTTHPGIYVAAETPPTSFRVFIVVHAVKSDWQDIVIVNPEYPSLEMCEAARSDLVDGFLQFMERRYLQPFRAESKCAKSDDDA